MAESGTSGSWWGGWIQSAKEKAVSSLEFVKKDLSEFSNVMHKDTAAAAVVVKEKINQDTATEATKKVKDGMSSILGGISKALIIEPEDKYDRGQPITADSHIFDRAKARLRAIQLDPETYCSEPIGDRDDYTKWLSSFVLEAQKGAISELLVSNVEVRGLYTQLVPSQISHANFWQRYFYKVHQLEQDEARKAALKKRAEVGAQEAELEWDDDDEWGDLESPVPSSSSATDSSSTIEPRQESLPSPSSAADPSTTSSLNKEASQVASSGRANEPTQEQALKTDSQSPVDSVGTESSGTEEKSLSPDQNYVKVSSIAEADRTLEATSSQMEVDGTSPKPDKVLPLSDTKDKEDSEISAVADVQTKDKGDLVVVGADRNTPSSDSSQSKVGNPTNMMSLDKELSSVDDDWEKDFDIEVSEEDIRLAQEAARKLAENKATVDDDDDWENWD